MPLVTGLLSHVLRVSHLFPITTVTRRMFASFNVEWLFIEMSRITQGMDYYNRIVIRRDNVLPHYAAHVTNSVPSDSPVYYVLGCSAVTPSSSFPISHCGSEPDICWI